MRIPNFVASFSSVALASALALPISSTPLDSVVTTSLPVVSVPTTSIPADSISMVSMPVVSVPTTSILADSISTAFMPVVSVPTTSIPADSISTASVPVVSVPTTSITVVSTTNVANSPEVTKLLLGLDTIDEAITTVTGSIEKSDSNLDVGEICQNFSSNGIINIAINDVLLQTQSLQPTVTSDASKSIVDVLQTKIVPHYQELLQLLEDKMGDLKSASLQNADQLNTLLRGDNWLDVISSGLQLGLANHLIIALIKVLDPAYRTVASEAGTVIKNALDSSVKATSSQ
ncbi:uncharacterized protein LY79DRAFT_570600 [Colletotrichum navitas]|uniref:Cell wall protein n=1 Tax=Colletotrichum navitas TaxID=681940 RepID=A0AAD8PMM5_9PEZI|nr:uncharacterized protein LY79DRAFT_570600 [Colletotrichum navitas]KAK1570057.1 hypothetical protein LY79DRAFT_570600 [Colletotrichum navitas]